MTDRISGPPLTDLRPRTSPCPGADVIASLSQLLGPEPSEGIRHVIECEECTESLELLAGLRSTMAVVEDLPEGAAARAFASLDLKAPSTIRRGTLIARGANIGLAAVAGFFGTLLVTSGAGAPELNLGLAGAVMLGALVSLQDKVTRDTFPS